MATRTTQVFIPDDILKRLERELPALRGQRKHKSRVMIALYEWLAQREQSRKAG